MQGGEGKHRELQMAYLRTRKHDFLESLLMWLNLSLLGDEIGIGRKQHQPWPLYALLKRSEFRVRCVGVVKKEALEIAQVEAFLGAVLLSGMANVGLEVRYFQRLVYARENVDDVHDSIHSGDCAELHQMVDADGRPQYVRVHFFAHVV